MALATITIPSDGSTTLLTVNFALGYIETDEVTCRAGDEVDGTGSPVYRALTWQSPTLVQVAGGAIPVGQNWVFKRSVPRDTLIVDWEDGDPITAENLDKSQKQAIMLTHEALDGVVASVKTASGDEGPTLADPEEGKVLGWLGGNIGNFAYPAGAAAAEAEASAAAAAASASAASGSASAAAISEANAAASAVTAATGGFQNIAAAKAFSPVTAPATMTVQGYLAPGDCFEVLQFAKVASEPTHPFKYFITLSDTVTVAWYEQKFNTRVRPEMLGCFPYAYVETEVQNWYNACSVKPTYNNTKLVNLYVRFLKLTGIWAKATVILIPAMAPSKADCGINLKAAGTNNFTVNGTGTFIAGVGFVGNNSNAYLLGPAWSSLISQNAAFIASKFLVNNFADSDSNISSIPTGTSMGVGGTPRSVAGNFSWRLCNSSAVSIARAYRSNDFILSRDNSANYKIYQEGELWQTVTATSIAVTSETATILRSGGAYCEDTAQIVVIGNAGLTEQEAAYLDKFNKWAVNNAPGYVGHGVPTSQLGFTNKQATGTMTTAMNACAAIASEKALTIALDYGDYPVNSPFEACKSLVITEGRHKYLTSVLALGLSSTVPLIYPGHYNGGEAMWSIQNLCVDMRAMDRGITSVGTPNRPGSSGISVCGGRDYTIHDVLIMEGILHGIDMCNTGVVSTGEVIAGEPTVVGQRYYDTTPSPEKYEAGVVSMRGHVFNIEGYSCGDDIVTRHYDQDSKTHDIRGFIPSGRHGGGARVSMVCEVDDGANGGEMYNIYGFGFNRVSAVKNHAPAPAPRGVSVRNITSERSGSALFVYDSNVGTGHGHVISKVHYTRPYRIDSESFMCPVQIDSVEGVTFSGLYAEATGREGNDLYPALMMLTTKRCKVGQLTIRNWAVTNSDSSPAYATVRVGSDNVDASITDVDIIGAGKYAINDSGSEAPDFANIRATGTGVSSSAVIRYGGDAVVKQATNRAVKMKDVYSAGVSGFTAVTTGL